MRNIEDVFKRLSKSSFRSGFELRGKELEYLRSRGLAKVMSHASDFIDSRLSPAQIPNDGKQTPMRNHPVFVAQHATATCCRGCLRKWHGIPGPGHELTPDERSYVLSVIERWIRAYI